MRTTICSLVILSLIIHIYNDCCTDHLQNLDQELNENVKVQNAQKRMMVWI